MRLQREPAKHNFVQQQDPQADAGAGLQGVSGRHSALHPTHPFFAKPRPSASQHQLQIELKCISAYVAAITLTTFCPLAIVNIAFNHKITT